MSNFNSNLVDQDLNAPLNENQAQDENRSDSETQMIMDEIVLASVNDLHDEYDRQENDNLRSKKLHFREEELEHINVMRNSNQSHLEAQIKELEELYANLKTSSEQEKAHFEAQIKEAEIENNEKQLEMIELEELLTNQQTRAEELQKKKNNLEKNSQLEKMVLEARIRETEVKKDEQNSKIKELEEVITNLESTEQEHLKMISDLETKALKQSRDDAALLNELNALNEAAMEREIIPSKNTGKKWKKGLLIGGTCVVAAVALWKYGPGVAGIASGFLRGLVGNLF